MRLLETKMLLCSKFCQLLNRVWSIPKSCKALISRLLLPVATALIDDFDQNQMCTPHDIFKIQQRCKYLSRALHLATENMPHKTWIECCGMAIKEIELGGVVALYQGRSELGPRALGHRSILADPRKKGLVRFINEHVKKRESFRPFAPSVLAEYASEWFETDKYNDENFSPFMSLTAIVKPQKRARIPAVTHVDGSSRLQTVTPQDEPLYHRLITKFYELTGVPMVLNTSFNTCIVGLFLLSIQK